MRTLSPAFAATCALAAVIAVAVPGLAAGPPSQAITRGLLFRLDKPGLAPSYVFGTVHSADPRVTALPKPVADALAAAKSFALETWLAEGDVAAFFAAAQLEDGRRLTDFFDASALAAIRAALGAAAPGDDILLRLKPWAVLLMLGERPVAGDGETLDARLLAEAKRRRLAIVGLEMPDEQVSAFDAIPLATQIALTHYVLASRDALVRDHAEVIDAWLDRDLGRLELLSAAPGKRDPEIAPHFARLARHLVDDRSAQMAHRLFLPLRSGRVFVAVGAQHLAGERGLLALLRDQGYRVRVVY